MIKLHFGHGLMSPRKFKDNWGSAFSVRGFRNRWFAACLQIELDMVLAMLDSSERTNIEAAVDKKFDYSKDPRRWVETFILEVAVYLYNRKPLRAVK